MRCVHEASLYDENCFITLTYDNEHLPALGNLDRAAFPLFMKRLRKAISPRKVRFYHAGEYGDSFGRPHYHACLFGFDFPDKELYTERAGLPVWRSELLQKLWPFGRTEIGSVTFESAAYVARYILKKLLGKDAEHGYDLYDGETGEIVGKRVPEYTTMSRRPGIGRGWYEKFKDEVYPSDSVLIRGQLMKPPRAYDLYLEEEAPAMLRRLKAHRRAGIDPSEQTYERLEAKEAVTIASVNLYK